MIKKTEKVNYFENLDILRVFLALAVVIFHIPEISASVLHVHLYSDFAIFHKGTEAVFFFFTLSGFLITRLLLIERDVYSDINLKMFYLRRVLRIWPVYFAVIIVGILYYHIILPRLGIVSKANYSIGEALLLCVFFLSNVFQRLFRPGSILSITWSIGVEEQFYLLWPLLFKKSSKGFILGFLIVLYLIIASYNFLNPGSILLKYRFLFDFMIIGGVMALLIQKYEQILIPFFKSKLVLFTFFVLFVLVFFTNVFNPISSLNEQLYHTVCGLISIGWIVTLAFSQPISALKKFTYLGKISYGIYMYHMIMVNFVLFIVLKTKLAQVVNIPLLSIIINFSVIALTLILSHLSYKYFETYFLSLKNKFTKVKPAAAN
ncbi:Peptidoglycan/LPS O-acetylase OafA/YrhL, contains acyltransferase and SGNH-hydrolase domains [Mucilaginibacter gossypiicola]|uniref:Peptidoglycan/LPS O-acetylase OafA/YrhL, contains acyltransferase and SGNH-hydrolase domains n=1 Tax=Mucilaginibacter gossypiicola TaxID=551995 RepID=A0A1H8NAW6_9SPHI|nr:acyltransferase [Mucilaginibacter gossypiicola]SEO26734.1 Peptidoglycan/LPS O-acetylase OafA/YrhL, contains acyltransferase and SGNH-hydrolase domains [Mucilaginibacter gossypiicola]